MLGTAFIAASTRVIPHLKSPWIGGTGRSSIDWNGPFGWRESIESGNLNGPSIASLGSGLSFLNSSSKDQFTEKSDVWLRRILNETRDCKNLALVGYRDSSGNVDNTQRVPLVSFSSQSLTSHEMAMLLDSTLGVECRSGLHCAGAIHQHLGSDPKNGTLRMSFGHTTAESDVDIAIEGIRLLDQVAL